VHHVCQGIFETQNGYENHLPKKCVIHHPNNPFKASKPAPTPPSPSNRKSSKKSDGGKDLDLMKKRAGLGALPTSRNKNSAATSNGPKTSQRVESQHLYFPCFTTFARHQTAELFVYNTNVVKQVISTSQAGRHLSRDRMAERNAEVESWWASKRKSDKPLSVSIFDENIGEDGLSTQSTYDVALKAIRLIRPNPKLLEPLITDQELVKNYYSILAKAVYELRAHHSQKNTLRVNDVEGKSSNTNISQVLAKKVTLKIDDAEFKQWSNVNQFAWFWHCIDLESSPILKIAVEKALDKTEHLYYGRNLFPVDEVAKHKRVYQFVGFVSSHTTANTVTCFHLHSFVVFYTSKDETVVTCILTSREHILTNMQDRVLQMMQLIQFRHSTKFLVAITNDYIGEDIIPDDTSLVGYKMMGFHTSKFFSQEDDRDTSFCLRTEHVIPIAVYDNRFTWAKYGETILPSIGSLSGFEKFQMHTTFRRAFHELLRIDGRGRLNPVHSRSKIKNVLLDYFDEEEDPEHHNDKQEKAKVQNKATSKEKKADDQKDKQEKSKDPPTTRDVMFFTLLENEEKRDFLNEEIVNLAMTSTMIPLSVFTHYFHRRFSKRPFLETTLELLHQAYIRMEDPTQSYDIFPGDKCKFSLKCSCCQSSITASGSIAETLYHSPIAIILHWGFLKKDQPSTDFELNMIPMLFASTDAYQRCLASFEKTLESCDEDLLAHQCASCPQYQYYLEAFNEAAKVDIAKSNDSNYKEILTSTVSLVTVLFEDFGSANEIHSKEKQAIITSTPNYESKLASNAILMDSDYSFGENELFSSDDLDTDQKDTLKSLEALCLFGYREFVTNLLSTLMKVNKKIFGDNVPVDVSILDLFNLSEPSIQLHMRN
ncbi:MAG: hypothetical protein RJB42_1207, partial [Bacteroidota bacterium]